MEGWRQPKSDLGFDEAIAGSFHHLGSKAISSGFRLLPFLPAQL
jgi:hypothetical protein